VTSLLDERVVVDHEAPSKFDALFREARRRRRRRWALGCCSVVMVTALGLTAGLWSTTRNPVHSEWTSRPIPPGPAAAGSAPAGRATNLDIFSGSLQLRVRFDARGRARSKVPAAPGVAPPVALARAGYVIGAAMGPIGTYASISNDLQTVLYSWPSQDGSSPAPATDRADVWLTGPGGRPGVAQEYDGRGHVVGPAVSIPPDMGVTGEVGTTLVLVGPPPEQDLALWDPQGHRLLLTLGPWDQEATSGSTLAWTDGSVLRVATAMGSVVQTIEGPTGDWATALAFSPSGSRIAVAWAPHPGSVLATARTSIDEHSELYVVDTSSGMVQPVPGSRGATGPVAWAPGGGLIFFGQAVRHGSSVAVSSYSLGGRRATLLRLSGASLPGDFSPPTAALVAWSGR
jgi:hypothetical protein